MQTQFPWHTSIWNFSALNTLCLNHHAYTVWSFDADIYVSSIRDWLNKEELEKTTSAQVETVTWGFWGKTSTREWKPSGLYLTLLLPGATGCTSSDSVWSISLFHHAVVLPVSPPSPKPIFERCRLWPKKVCLALCEKLILPERSCELTTNVFWDVCSILSRQVYFTINWTPLQIHLCNKSS